MNNISPVFNQRRAGVFAHITSLPGSQESGDLGQNAYYFIDFLSNTGFSVWQTLPLGMPHEDGSPYQCMSAYAGNTKLISRSKLVDSGWLEVAQQNDKNILDLAYDVFIVKATTPQKREFTQFCASNSWWLDDFAIYLDWKNMFPNKGWFDWPQPYCDRNKSLIKQTLKTNAKNIATIKFSQFIFFKQWMELKEYANKKNIFLFGDMPIFVAHDSVDVWVNRSSFKLNADGSMRVVAGVPPDYFAETGQRWGNPHFDWQVMQRQKFSWWLQRIKKHLQLFDIVRIDHFRGFIAAWEIPACETTAVNGKWVKAPGQKLFNKINQSIDNVALVAEDLGVITEEVQALRDRFKLYGMKVLQFGFSNDCNNPHEPHNCTERSVIYTGTHDNDTTVGWYQKLSVERKQCVDNYLRKNATDMPDVLIDCALASVAKIAILPMQDILMLDSNHRMNTPGTTEGNWLWRFSWQQLSEQRATYIRKRLALYNRI